jgi:hypothetical protein
MPFSVRNLSSGPRSPNPPMPQPPSTAHAFWRAFPARPWRALLGVALVLGGIVPVTHPGSAEAAGRPGGPLVPASGMLVGAYNKHGEGSGFYREKEATEDLEAHMGRNLDIGHHFYGWDDEFPTMREHWDLRNHRIPLISWNGTFTPSITSGALDGTIAARAAGVRNLGQPVFVRWFWEMDGNKKANWTVSPESYIAAWRHIVDTFRAQGATNAVWVWCPNASAFDDHEAGSYYPGDGYVDWICADGYNFAPNKPGSRWRSFTEIFTDFYAYGRSKNKPLMLAEWGVLERNPDEKARWLDDTRAVLRSRFPNIAAAVYFNADSTDDGVFFDWRVDTTPSALDAFVRLANAYHPSAPAAPTPTPAPAPTPAAPPVKTPRTPRPAAPAAPTSSDKVFSVTFEPPRPGPLPGPPRVPTARLTWVLEMLQRLDDTITPAPRRG